MWWRRSWIRPRFDHLSYSQADRLPWDTLRRRGGVGFSAGFFKNPFQIFCAGSVGWGRRRDLSDIATPDFLGEAAGCVLADFFKFAQPRVGETAAETKNRRQDSPITGLKKNAVFTS